MSAADVYQEIPTTFNFTAAANSSGDITVPNRPSLTIIAYSAGLSLAGTARLVFNGDTGSNYVTTYNSVASAATIATNTANASAAAAIFTPSQTTAFLAVFKVTNLLAVAKAFTFRITYFGTAPPVTAFGGGEWVNTTAQITQVRLIASANNFLAGSGFWVLGGDGI